MGMETPRATVETSAMAKVERKPCMVARGEWEEGRAAAERGEVEAKRVSV